MLFHGGHLMPIARFLLAILAAAVLLFWVLGGTSSAQTQSDPELDKLKERILALQDSGKWTETIPLVERYVALIKKRKGENDPEYASMVSYLGKLLQSANRGDEAEPLMRRA